MTRFTTPRLLTQNAQRKPLLIRAHPSDRWVKIPVFSQKIACTSKNSSLAEKNFFVTGATIVTGVHDSFWPIS